MSSKGPAALAAADFRRARRRADTQRVLSLISGQEERLLSYDEVRKRLHAVETARQELAYIPLDAIVGSVGRYQDFTRSFMPRNESDAGRWIGVQRAMTGLAGVPPIEVYKLGDAYFVKDGNHRVSVARQMGAKHIDAYVTEVATRVPFSADMDQDDLILASEFAQFLDRTNLDKLRPDADLRVTAPGSYPQLLEHIEVHRYFMGIDEDRPIEWQEAVEHWYDVVYTPVARAIAQHGLLDGFPGRTEADLYLFLSEHRAQLEKEFGWSLEGPLLAEGLAPSRRFGDLEERAGLLTDPGSVAGLLDSVLLVLQDDQADDVTLRHGLELARAESAVVLGFAPVAPQAELRRRFEDACRAHGVKGQLAFGRPEALRAVVREVQARARYADLVVVPAAGKLTRALLRHSPKPLLLATEAPTATRRPLLAYDGGAKADEALFVVAYLSVTRKLRPVVLHVGKDDGLLARAGEYLERLGVAADLVSSGGPVAEAIVRVAAERGCDSLFVGSHSGLRWVEEMLGGVLDELIELTELPIIVT